MSESVLFFRFSLLDVAGTGPNCFIFLCKILLPPKVMTKKHFLIAKTVAKTRTVRQFEKEASLRLGTGVEYVAWNCMGHAVRQFEKRS